MILEDKYLMARLGVVPEFAVRLHELVAWHALQDKAALVLQCRPELVCSLADTLGDKAFVERFQTGQPSRNNWWNGFASMVQPQPTFHGIAGLPSMIDPNWTFEIHQDGHLLAAIWNFPEMPYYQSAVAVLPEFYSEFFGQFFTHAKDLLASSDASLSFALTATLLNAGKLHYAAKSWGAHYQVAGTPPPLPHLQCPVTTADMNSESWALVGSRMASQLFAAFPKPK